MLWLSKKHAAETQRGNGERQKRDRIKDRERQGDEQAYGEEK